MTRLRTISVALGVMGAICFITTSAQAAPEWLIDGSMFSAETPLQISGTVRFSDAAAGIRLGCHFILDGEITAANDVMILALLMENGELLTPAGTAGTATDGELDMIDCSIEKAGGCKSGLEVLLKTLNMPWLIELTLVEPKPSENLRLARATSTVSGDEVGYEAECTNILGGKTTDSCFGNVSFALENMPTEAPKDVLGTATQRELEENGELLLCSFKNELTGFIEATEGLLFFSEAGLDLEVTG